MKIKIALSLLLISIFSQLRAETIQLDNFQTTGEVTPSKVWYKLSPEQSPDTAKFAEKPLPSFPLAKGTHIFRFMIQGKLAAEVPLWIKLPFLNCESIRTEICDSAGNSLITIKPEDQGGMVYRIQDMPVNAAFIQFSVRSSFAVFFPIKFQTTAVFNKAEKRDNLFWSIYFGVIIIMAFYNLFIFISTKSLSYLYYSLYTLTFGLAQFCLSGYFASIINSDLLTSKLFAIVFSGISGVFGIIFFNSFLETKINAPRIRKALLLVLAAYVITIIFGMGKKFEMGFNFLNLCGMGVGILFLSGSAFLAFRKKSRPALFYFIAWLMFITSLVFYILTNVGALPYNGFTQFLLPLGSALEISLLSFALADKINILSTENETLVREQNIRLEKEVAERTAELVETNKNLKETQAQLVNSEKMASLGHLTAGIAHEINNPINFISANISPLKRDIQDYEALMDKILSDEETDAAAKIESIKKLATDLDIKYVKSEIETLLKGIDEGARRTAEIVKNLKIFSHIDKAEHSYYSLNEGIESTLHLLSHKLGRIQVRSNLHQLPPILCYPGKINQVFMNILSNAIDAMQQMDKGTIDIESELKDGEIVVKIRDNGHGIPPEILKDIFNPFFTTKDVGSGTGLGLSISQSIIHEHGGSIEVESEIDKGSTFTITIPVKI